MNISDRTFELFEENQNLINNDEFSKFLKTVYAYTNNLDIVAQALYVLSQTMPDETIQDLIEYSNNKNAASTKSEDYHIELNDGSLEFEILYDEIIANMGQHFVNSTKYFRDGLVTLESLIGADMYSIAPSFDQFSPDDLLESFIDALIAHKDLSPANLNGIKNEGHLDLSNNVGDELRKYLAHILAIRILATVLIDQFEIYYKICYERFGLKLKPGMNGNAGCFSIKLDDFYKKMINFRELPFDNGAEALLSIVTNNPPKGAPDMHDLYVCLYVLWWIAHEKEFDTEGYVRSIQSIQMSDINNLLERFSGYGCFNLTRNEEAELWRIVYYEKNTI